MKIEVTGQVQPAEGVKVTRESTRHPSFSDMPDAPGSALAGEPVPQRLATPKPTVAGVSRKATQHPAIEELPIPATCEYKEPPAKVVAEGSQPA